MLRISKLTDYGTVVLACLAASPHERHPATAVAERTRVGLPTVSKLLKSFHRAGLLTSTRGSRGGYRLSRPASAISAAAIIDAIEGPVAITECSGDHSACDFENSCSTLNAWQRINGAIRRSLDVNAHWVHPTADGHLWLACLAGTVSHVYPGWIATKEGGMDEREYLARAEDDAEVTQG